MCATSRELASVKQVRLSYLTWSAPGGEEVHHDQALRMRAEFSPEFPQAAHRLHASSAPAQSGARGLLLLLLIPARAAEEESWQRKREASQEAPSAPSISLLWRWWRASS